MKYLIVYPQEGQALSHKAAEFYDVDTAASLWSGIEGAELIVFDVRDGSHNGVEILRMHNHGRRINAHDAIKLVRYHHALYLSEAA